MSCSTNVRQIGTNKQRRSSPENDRFLHIKSAKKEYLRWSYKEVQSLRSSQRIDSIGNKKNAKNESPRLASNTVLKLYTLSNICKLPHWQNHMITCLSLSSKAKWFFMLVARQIQSRFLHLRVSGPGAYLPGRPSFLQGYLIHLIFSWASLVRQSSHW